MSILQAPEDNTINFFRSAYDTAYECGPWTHLPKGGKESASSLPTDLDELLSALRWTHEMSRRAVADESQNRDDYGAMDRWCIQLLDPETYRFVVSPTHSATVWLRHYARWYLAPNS